jgi:PAS domain S-box-containing protein
MDEHGHIVRWGDAAAALFGWSEDEVLGRTVADTIVPSFYREAHRRGVAACVAGRRPVLTGRFIEVTALRRDGSEFPMELVITAATTPDGRIQFTAALRDVSGIDVSRRLRQLELDVSRSLMQPAISEGLEGALAITAEGLGCDVAQLWLSDAGSPTLTRRYRWECGSERVARFVALRADDLLPAHEALAAVWRSGLPFVADTGMAHTEALLSGATQAGLSCMLAFPLPATERHSGALLLLAAASRPVDEELLAVMGSITSQMGQALARDQAERSLREDRFRALLEAAPDAILGVGADERITLMNVAAERLFGYAREELLGQSIEVLISEAAWATHPALRHGYFTARPRAGGERQALATRRKDGTEFPAEISLSALEGDDGMLVMVSVRDVTERIQGQQAMQRAIAAELANEAKTAFMSRVSHELRTPLNAILGFAELMTMADLPEQQREHAQIIHRAGSHLHALIRDVLDFSCIEAGNLPLWMEPVSIEKIVREAIELVSPMAAERRISTTVELAAPSEPHVLADPQRLRQVVVNLLSNAVKYNRPDGRVRLILQEGNGRTRLGVIDTGSGISSEHLPRLFQPFDRLGAERSGIEGTGLGLAFSKHLVTAMGGSLTVDSRPGDGSTFWVDLTSASAPAGPAEDAVTDLTGAAMLGDRRSILYVEDNENNLRLMRSLLSLRPDLALTSAARGRLGLQMARDRPPDLVLLDLDLPDLQGDEVLCRLRADERTARIPVIIISADASDHERHRLLAAGATAFLTKPLDVRQLFVVVDEALATGSRR